MSKITTDEIFEKLKADLTDYVKLKLELLKLNTYERIGKVIAILAYCLILVLLGFFAILFIFLALGFFIGSIFDSIGLGFTSVTLIYIIIMGIIYKFKSKICDAFMNIVVGALYTSDDESEDDQLNNTDNEPNSADTDRTSETE